MSDIIGVKAREILDSRGNPTVEVDCLVNGKLRGSIDVSVDLGKDEILNLAKKHNNVIKFLDNKEIIKEIYIPKKIINFVV